MRYGHVHTPVVTSVASSPVAVLMYPPASKRVRESRETALRDKCTFVPKVLPCSENTGSACANNSRVLFSGGEHGGRTVGPMYIREGDSGGGGLGRGGARVRVGVAGDLGSGANARHEGHARAFSIFCPSGGPRRGEEIPEGQLKPSPGASAAPGMSCDRVAGVDAHHRILSIGASECVDHSKVSVRDLLPNMKRGVPEGQLEPYPGLPTATWMLCDRVAGVDAHLRILIIGASESVDHPRSVRGPLAKYGRSEGQPSGTRTLRDHTGTRRMCVRARVRVPAFPDVSREGARVRPPECGTARRVSVIGTSHSVSLGIRFWEKTPRRNDFPSVL